MPDERADRVASFAEKVAPEGGVEAIADEPRVRGALEATPGFSPEEHLGAALEAVERLDRGRPLEPEHVDLVEAIILPAERPVVDIVGGTYEPPEAPFERLGTGEARRAIEAAIPAIGRVELPDHPSLPYGGTGFVVGEDLLMTNRHVAELFAVGLGREVLRFRPGQRAAVDLLREHGSAETRLFEIERVVMVHPYWDMALLATRGLAGVTPLRLTVAEPGDLAGREVAVIGYPALDARNDIELQNRIFRGVFNVKRLQPGLLRERREVPSYGHPVSAVTHDSSTLGGNSGSAVIDVDTGTVAGLHFAGRYLDANFAVPSRELALDPRVVEAGVAFDGEAGGAGPPPWQRLWDAADPPGETPAATAVAAAPVVAPMTWTIPLELTVQLRSPGAVGVTAALEAPRDRDYASRHGYDADFLGVPVPLPEVRDLDVASKLDDGSHVLRYEHFSLAMHRLRRLAIVTASNVDASPARKLAGELGSPGWITDPRIPALHQLPDRFFTRDRGAFDRGHVVRREDVEWGDTFEELRRANADSFHVTNCSPQVARFNQSREQGLWGLLENMILDQADTERLCVLAGPVLAAGDPPFSGVDSKGPVEVLIPRKFWKVVVARGGDGLQAFAFVLEQDLSDVDFAEFIVEPRWRSSMISLPGLEELTGLVAFDGALHDADRSGAAGGEALLAVPGLERFSG